MPMLAIRTAQFSAAATDASKEALLQEVATEAAKISDYNFRSYFVRRATED